MTEPPRALRASISLASASALAYEILLLRLFSITQFHHTAYMILSLALLGYGASGTVLAARGADSGARRGARRGARFSRAYGACLIAAAGSMLLSFAAAQRIAVHPEELLWDPVQALRLGGVYLILALPFLFVGLAIGLALMRYRAGTVYAWDLTGAGAGSLLILALLWSVRPEEALRWLASLAIVAAAFELSGRGADGLRRLGIALLTLLGVWVVPARWIELELSPYKGLSQALLVDGARVVSVDSSPLAQVVVVENPVVPLRYAPGLSLAAPLGPPEQIGLFIDGDALTAVARASDREALSYLDYSTAALPYHVARPASVLVLGAGGGEGVLRARVLGADHVVAVEIDPNVARLVSEDLAIFSGGLFSLPGIELVRSDIRGFVSRSEERFDLIELAALGGFGGGGPALASLSESFVYTIEALTLYLDRLRPDGVLALTTWAKHPPRSSIKLAAGAIEALERRGDGVPSDRLALIRGWQTSTLLVKQQPFSTSEVERLRSFCRERFFDVVYYPGMEEVEANRFNRVAEPLMHRAVVALLGAGREEFLRRGEFDLRPATDDRPFFHQFFRWRTLPGILEARGSGGLSLLEAGYLVLVVSLLQALLLGLILIVIPWIGLRREIGPGNAGGGSKAGLVVYFFALGLGFLFLEVAFLQKFILFLHHPVYSAVVVLASFLVFAGMGSASSDRVVRRHGSRSVLIIVGAIITVGLVDLFLLGLLAPWLAGSSLGLRVLTAVLLIAPLAFFMGMPFPIGLTRVRERGERLVPWAWAINGCASVVSPILATLLAIQLGFSIVVILALMAYGAAGLAFGKS